jgi:hypothetical protein
MHEQLPGGLKDIVAAFRAGLPPMSRSFLVFLDSTSGTKGDGTREAD